MATKAIRVMVIVCLAADPCAQTPPNRLGLGSILFLDSTGSRGGGVDDRDAFWRRFEVPTVEGQQRPDARVVSTLGNHRVVGSSAGDRLFCESAEELRVCLVSQRGNGRGLNEVGLEHGPGVGRREAMGGGKSGQDGVR